ncbi:hypothetical protein SRB5_47410 [Streptomyces sp. RB5]|uniref:ABC-2 type transporter transmembrane domain-containing protein n=1 Tax=Streptomyces smaragdinus TaxID=2585196 RepID=A0A7K0CMT3_9ACTN|nr:ABC transporter permease [Streptomyces smaragdinus]MQY14573.1 hypothetical protein [Streptomyces smaragdinus]
MPRDSALRTAALVRLNTALLLRESGPLVSRLVLPLILLTLMRPLYQAAQGGAAGTEQAVVGILVMFSLLGMSLVGSAVLQERVWRTWDRLRTTPARPVELLAGKGLPVLVALLLQQALVLGYGAGLLGLDVRAPALLGVACLAWTVALLAMGAALGAAARSFGELSAAYDIGGMLLSALGGALVPLAELPRWVGAVAPLSPGYWGFGALRGAVRGDAGAVFAASGALLGFAAVAGVAAAWAIGRGRARSDRL